VTSRSIGQSLTRDATQRAIGAYNVVNAEPDTIAILEIEFAQIAVQMTLATMLINASDASLENAVKAFNSVRVDEPAHIFIGFMADALMAREMIHELGIMAAFISHHRGFFRNIGLDDWNDIGGAGSLDMEGARLPGLAIDKRQYRVLMAMAAPLDGSLFAPDKSFVGFDNSANPAHWRKRTVAHGFSNSVSEKPSGFHATNEHSLNLAGSNALFASAHQMDDLQPKMQRQMGGLENGPHAHGKWLATLVAFVKAAAGGFASQLANALFISIAAMRASWAMRPKTTFDISESAFLILELRCGKNGIGHGNETF
jgi:hypothetical protein